MSNLSKNFLLFPVALALGSCSNFMHNEPVEVAQNVGLNKNLDELKTQLAELNFCGITLASQIDARRFPQREIFAQNLGLKFTKNSFNTNLTDEEKILDLMNLASSDVDIIWAARGGHGSFRLIKPLSKYHFHKKKVFVGYSDLTAMNLFLSKFSNWKVIHGPMICDLFDYNNKSKSVDLLIDILKEDVSYKFKISPLYEQDSRPIKGRITGGNLTLIEASLKTAWEINTDNKILVLEDVNVSPEGFYRSLYHLWEARKLDKVKALVVGSINGKYPTDPFKNILTKVANLTKKPIFLTDKIGHGKFNFPFVYETNAVIEGGTIYLKSCPDN